MRAKHEQVLIHRLSQQQRPPHRGGAEGERLSREFPGPLNSRCFIGLKEFDS